MKAIVGVALLAALGAVYYSTTGGAEYDLEEMYRSEFMSFVTSYDRNYHSALEMNMRYEVFKNTLDEINEHNAGDHTWKKGVNKFADWTQEERDQVLGFKASGNRDSAAHIFRGGALTDVDPIDWRDFEGAVGPIQDQGSCGSCWAFSAVVAMEHLNWWWNEETDHLSEQQLVDCCHNMGSDGCNGGEMLGAFEYYAQDDVDRPDIAQPAAFNEEYPYHGKNEVCNHDLIDFSLTHMGGISHHVLAEIDTTGDIGKEVVKYRVASVGVNANSWFSYSSGIITDDTFNPKRQWLNHGVGLIGWGTEDGIDYFLLKNSWGERWGEGGYLRVGVNDQSGVCQEISYPEYRC